MRESNMRSNVSQDLVGFRTASPYKTDKTSYNTAY